MSTDTRRQRRDPDELSDEELYRRVLETDTGLAEKPEDLRVALGLQDDSELEGSS